MSVTDRAFIKAYAPREQSAAPPEAAHGPRESSTEELCSPAPPEQTGAASRPHRAAPEPLSLPASTANRTVRQPAQPLSAFVAEVELQQALAPALEVEAFLWPDVCTQLLQRAEIEFDQWAARLTSEAIRGRNLVLLSGLMRGEGRTTALLCLAQRLAACGVRTVLVDADFQKPGLAEALGVAVTTSWEDVLLTGAPLHEALVISAQDQLTLLPLGEHVAKPMQLARSLQTPVGLHALADDFDVVLVDAGPAVGADATATVLMQQLADANVVLTRNARMTNPEVLAELQQQLQAAQIRLLGVAENFCPPADARRSNSIPQAA